MQTRYRIIFILTLALQIIASCGEASPKVETDIPTGTASVAKIIPTKTAAKTTLSLTAIALQDTPTPTPIPATPTPDVSFEEVTFTTDDGVDIAATLFGEGDLGVILLHMGKGIATGNDQEDWHPLARTLAERGYSALTIDFRGRGDSGGEFVNDPVILDAQEGLDFLRGRGLTRFVCIGAGVGGTTCMVLTLTNDLAGLVVLSGSLSAGPTNQVTEAHLAQLSIPKLYLYGERDGFGFPEAMQKIYQVSAGPKELITCDTAAHGSDLLNADCDEDIQARILVFLDEID